jgi:hypothetical protein
MAGVIGAAVSVLVVFYLYRAIKNPAHSAIKKVALSALYVIGGVVGTVILATLFTYGLAYQGVADHVLKNEPPFTSNSTPSVLKSGTSGASADLENNNYMDAKTNFRIYYPKKWKIDTSGANGNVEFDSPVDGEVALKTVTVENVQSYGYDLQTIARDVMHNFKSSAPSAGDVKVVAEGNTTLDGEPAYEYEVSYNYPNGSENIPFHAIYVISLHSGAAYTIFTSSMEQVWDKYKNAFNDSISSLKY